MAAIVHMLLSPLLLSLIPTGVNGAGGLVLAERGYAFTVPCEEDLACLHIWQLDSPTRDYVAMVSAGESRTATGEAGRSKCTLRIKDLTEEDVGRHHCQQRPGVFSQTSPDLTLMPGRSVSLQCILLSFLKGYCYARRHQVQLTWVDEAGAEVQPDPQHQIQQDSPCDVTLTVTFQSPGNKKFRCQATVGKHVQTSEGLQVRVPDLKGRGRGRIIDLEPENQGVNGAGGLVLAERGYAFTVPCEEDLACLHIWQLDSPTRDYVAMVSAGESRTATGEAGRSKCTLRIKDLTEEDVGRHHCQQRPGVFSQTSPDLTLMPGRSVSLQCILLSFLKGYCYARRHQVQLTWVDEAGAEVQPDPQHQIQQDSPCDVTLTVTFQSPGNKKFRCQATVGKHVQTSEGLQVRVPDLKGRGRGRIIDLEPENQGWDVIGAAVGVVGCVVVAALVALLAVNRRRRRRRTTRSRLPDESCTNNVMDADDDVVYADIVHPVDPGRAPVLECESTEYACVRYS